MAQFIYKHRRGTTEKWQAATSLVPLDGELIVEERADGTFEIKVGDGIHTFNDLPYLNQSLIAHTQDELNSYLTDSNVGRTVSYNNHLYLIVNSDNGIVVKRVDQPASEGGGGEGSTAGIIMANNAAELMELLTSDNIGALIYCNNAIYVVESYQNPTISVGDTLSALYFDKNWLPYIRSTFGIDDLIKTGETKTAIIQNGETAEYTTQLGLVATNEDDPQQYKLVWRTCKYENIVLEQLTEDTIRVIVDGQLYYEGNIDGAGSLDDVIVDTVVYRDYEEFWANSGKPTGWLVDKLTLDSPVTVTELDGQEAWGDYITKAPLTQWAFLNASADVGARFMMACVPEITPEDVGKFLRVNSSGQIIAEEVPSAEEASF